MSTDTPHDTAGIADHEYLTFTLGDEEYGVDILKVQEIRGYDQVTRLPGADRAVDVGADRGGGVWAVSPTTVWYWPPGGGAPRAYAHGDGLARGNAAYPFTAVAGGLAGQAIVGNLGAIADHLTVDPASGKVLRVENMQVPLFDGPEYHEHLIRVVAALRVVADLDGTFGGTAYLGGIHGFTAWHGLATGGCKCERFQEHQHFIPGAEQSWCDSTVPKGHCWGGDVKGLALTAQGDVWVGDQHWVALMPQRSLGAFADFFQPFRLAVDVFPKVDDHVSALAVDGSGAIWVASFGHGLARLDPLTLLPSYFDRSRELPMNRLTAVAVDSDESVWVGTPGGGIARFAGGAWRYHTAGSGLPSDTITSLFVDRRPGAPRRVIIGSRAGVAVYSGP